MKGLENHVFSRKRTILNPSLKNMNLTNKPLGVRKLASQAEKMETYSSVTNRTGSIQ